MAFRTPSYGGTGTLRHTGKPGIDFLESRTTARKGEGFGPRSYINTGHTGKPGIDFLKSRTVEGGRETEYESDWGATTGAWKQHSDCKA